MQCQKVLVLSNENWVKQSFRNRVEVYGPNNRQKLSFPIQGSSKHGTIADVRLDNTHNWGVQNWRSLVTAYNKSPFFEYYKHELEPLFMGKEEFLFELNKKAIVLCCSLLAIDLDIAFQELDYNAVSNNYCSYDFRKLSSQKPYNQVFSDKNGFESNLSILDLLFNLGPEAGDYLLRYYSSE